MPRGARELSRIPNLGLKKIEALHAGLGIETIDELEAACLAGRVRTVQGMGVKTEQRILEGIRALRSAEAAGPITMRVLLPEALAMADRVLAHLRAVPGVTAAEIAGDLRRWCETVDRLVVVLASRRPEATLTAALASPLLVSSARDGLIGRATLVTGLPLELHATSPEHWAATWLLATGSAEHLEALRPVARERGVDVERATGSDEAQLYRRLGLPYIPPELREGAGEVEAARSDSLPTDLVTLEEIRGLVHCHTDQSDGRHTVEQMARAADALGMRYLTITDHSPAAVYANGLDVDRLRAQWDEIARVQETVSVRLLRGTEADILTDGALDYPDAVLEQLDVIIASIHARHRMDAAAMTGRIIRAMRHPCFKIWGHPLGRLVLSRPPIEAPVEEILDAIANSRAAIEINGDPNRLDLPPHWIRVARARSIPFVVSTDAHATGELANLRYGVALARRGWVRRQEVLNALDADAFARAVAPVRSGHGPRQPADR